MKNTEILPQNYHEILSVDLQKNKRLALGVNAAAAVISFSMFAAGCAFAPISFFGVKLRYLLAIIPAGILYIVLHELVHGIFMRILSGKRPHYGVTSLYAYAGSDCYFNKTSYIIIALAPVVIWGAVLVLMTASVPNEWFWTVYLIQMINIAGAAGDYYVTLRFLKLPKEILVQDTGVSMTVYADIKE